LHLCTSMSFLLYSRIWMRISRNVFLFSLNKLRDFLPCFIPTPASEYCISFSRDKRSDADRSRLSLLSFDGGNIGDKRDRLWKSSFHRRRKWERKERREVGKRSESNVFKCRCIYRVKDVAEDDISTRASYPNMSVIYFPRSIRADDLKNIKLLKDISL